MGLLWRCLLRGEVGVGGTISGFCDFRCSTVAVVRVRTVFAKWRDLAADWGGIAMVCRVKNPETRGIGR